MYLSNIFTNPAMQERYMDILVSSFLPLVKGAFYYTIPLTLITFAIGLILAVITALMRLSSVKVLQVIARIYVSIIRGTPLLVQLFIIFFGLPSVGVTINPLFSAIIGFSLNMGAYNSEIIRAAILSIPKGQWEAAHSIGMTNLQALRKVVLPQATRVSIPPLSNSFIGLIKDTSLASTITYTEMFRKAQEIAAQNYEFLLVYTEAAMIYWVICVGLSFVQDSVETRLERYVAK
ncbi:amino acid ABC transporter permease [Halobacillus litoralis]|uniref:amino acid ABC transporter permease n=1 Tax=Halobacillus litoralis TaxID=45668 RepID=UPI00249364C5|nr:amino acid ABC transporter permease [Halobacillus litoralis]